MAKLALPVERLAQEYKQGRSSLSLAEEFGVSVWTVLNRLRKVGVAIRKSQPEKRLDLTPEKEKRLREIVDGLLLGDGSIGQKGELRLEQCNSRVGWLHQVQDQLTQVGSKSKLHPIPPRVRVIEGREVRSKEATLLYTPCYVRLKKERKRWYPKGKRLVPRDLKLTPSVLAHWFSGDGTFDHSSGSLFFCTNGFIQEDTEFLTQLLVQQGIEATCLSTPREGQFKVAVLKRDEAMKVKILIEPLLPACCQYKLQHVRPSKWTGKLTREQVLEARGRAAQGETQTNLAQAFGVSVQAMHNIVRRKTYKYV